MADTGYKYAGAVTDGGGDAALPNYSNLAGAADAVYAGNVNGVRYTADISLFYDSSPIGVAKTFTLPLTTPGNVINGSSSDLWSATLTPGVINDSSFGVRALIVVGDATGTESYTIANNYSFTVPSGATIVGVEATLTGYYFASRGIPNGRYDSIGLKIYYTESSSQNLILNFLHYARLRSN